jgi:hypothetical protein
MSNPLAAGWHVVFSPKERASLLESHLNDFISKEQAGLPNYVKYVMRWSPLLGPYGR